MHRSKFAAVCTLALILPITAAAQQSTTAPRPLVGGHGNNVEGFIAQYDADSDGKVSWAEFEAQRRQRYDSTDADGNGYVDVQEYINEYDERVRQERERARVQQDAMTRTRFNALDSDSSAAISRTEFDASGDKQYLGYSKMAATEAKPVEERTAEGAARFDRRPGGALGMPTTHTRQGFVELYDDNADGNVDRAEFDKARTAQFARTDTDGNGELSFDEYFAEYEDRIERRIALLSDDSDKQTRIRFGVLDADKDGKLTWTEYQNSGKRTFDRADRSHDSIVDAHDATLPAPSRPQRATEPAASATAAKGS